MEQKHKPGYWINQLSDEQIEELAKTLLSTKNNFKLKSVKVARAKDHVDVLYTGRKTNTYLNLVEQTITLEDYRVRGQYNYVNYYEYMISILGAKYVDELIAFMQDYPKSHPEENNRWTKLLPKMEQAIPAILASQEADKAIVEEQEKEVKSL
ncbi:MAG: hypothetical protein IKM43_04500 [Clostridia bacterium]|nr:hypothetical protein [Clostridia bacterium]